MELMHKDAEYDGPIKVRDLSRWPLDSKAVQFLLLTATAYSIEELEKVENKYYGSSSANFPKHSLFSFTRREADMDVIRANVYTAEFSVHRGHDIPLQYPGTT